MQWNQPVEGSYGIQSTDFIIIMCSVLKTFLCLNTCQGPPRDWHMVLHIWCKEGNREITSLSVFIIMDEIPNSLLNSPVESMARHCNENLQHHFTMFLIYTIIW